MKKIILSLFLFCLAGIAYGQVINAPIEDFLDKHPKMHKYYIYQSALRMLNQAQDPDFDRLIKPLKKVNAFVSREDAGVTKEAFKSLLANLSDEDFELLFSFKEKDTLVQLMGKTHGSKTQYVFAVYGEDEFAIIEMDGSLDLQYLRALENLDFSKAEELLINQNRS